MREPTKKVQLEQYDVEHTTCFSGPRPANLPNAGDDMGASVSQIKYRLKCEIENCLNNDKSIFINGGMAGFDIIAGETVLSLKQNNPSIVCITIAPFRVGYFANTNWTPEWKQKALKVYTQSDIAFSLSETYHKGVYYERDRFLVDHSSVLICYYAGTGRGTKYTFDYAQNNNVPVHNIFTEEKQ